MTNQEKRYETSIPVSLPLNHNTVNIRKHKAEILICEKFCLDLFSRKLKSPVKNDMEQRDLLKDQIEQLGKVLAKILSDFPGLKSSNNVAQGIEISNERLQNEANINIDKLITLHKAELAEYVKNRKLTEDHLETLSEYLKEAGKAIAESNKNEAQSYLEKAIELLDIADETSKTMSFDRVNKKNKIKTVLQEYI